MKYKLFAGYQKPANLWRIGNGERYGRGTGQIYININTFTESRYKEKVNMIKRVENDKGKQRRVHAARVHHGLTNYIETKAKCRRAPSMGHE